MDRGKRSPFLDDVLKIRYFSSRLSGYHSGSFWTVLSRYTSHARQDIRNERIEINRGSVELINSNTFTYSCNLHQIYRPIK